MTVKTIAIDLFDGAEELDVVGPYEVLAYWTQNFPEDGWRVVLASSTGGAHVCAKGLSLTAQATLDDCGPIDLFIEPGGRGSRQRLRDQGHLERLRDLAGDGCRMVSVCTGALVYAAAGLLRGREVVTHHENGEELLAIEPRTRLVRGRRWVDDGTLVTAAGVSAGIDVALYLVGQIVSPERARQVQSGIEYYPQPPFGDGPQA